MRALNIAATGMLAQQLNVEVISNNIANLNTTGFKRQRAEFQDLLYQDQRPVGAQSSDNGTIVPVGVQVGSGVKSAAIYRITEQGTLLSTNNPLDIAIQGRGYFQIQMPDGTTAYTRAGSFQLSPTAEIVTADGYIVDPGITLPNNTVAVTVNPSGQVLAQIAGQTTPQTVGQFQLAAFPNEGGLEQLGGNLLAQTPASGAPTTGNPGATGYGTLQQGFVETSNVNVVSEITNLITAQRAYEMNSKVISTADQMSATLTQIQEAEPAMTRLLAALALLLMLPLAAAAAPMLKPAVTVRDPVIRLGDLFDDVGERAQVAVAASPPPGSRMVLGSGWLAALAESQHIAWQPTSRFDQVVVERASREIGADEISQRLLEALAERTPVANAELKLDAPAPRLAVAATDTGPLAVDGLSLDLHSGRFSAVLSASAAGDPGERLHVSGRLIRTAEVPVPARLLAAGEVIAAGDITTAMLRTDRVGADMLLQASDLVGKAPRRSLRPGEPVHASDVEIPLVVHRGTLVTILLETPALRLSTEGKAMDDGGMGAVIRVANTKSSRVIDAVVAGPGTVTVAVVP